LQNGQREPLGILDGIQTIVELAALPLFYQDNFNLYTLKDLVKLKNHKHLVVYDFYYALKLSF